MAFHEGQTVLLTADARIGDCAYIACGNSGYVEQVTTTKARTSHHRDDQDIFPSSLSASAPTEVVALVHFADLELKTWVPALILETGSGS